MKAATSESAADGRIPLPKRATVSSRDARLRGSAGRIQGIPNVFALKRCQNFLKQRLTGAQLDLFHELTGLRLHVWWHKPAAESQQGALPRPCPWARQRLAGKLPERCETCLRKRWQHAWNNHKTEKRFAGLCGSTNYCACVKVLDLHPVTLVVQKTAPVSRANNVAFRHAVNLARLIVHDLQATVRVGQASRLPLEFEHFSVQAFPLLRQSKELGAGETPALRSNHSQQIVQRMLDYIHEHYSRPMQLGDVAAAMNMNAAYVSSLFHTTTGVTFHHYLEELRLARAKDLLRDPVNQVCEVACAVGYTNPNHFRDVFKTRVRIPPSVWRDRPEP